MSIRPAHAPPLRRPPMRAAAWLLAFAAASAGAAPAAAGAGATAALRVGGFVVAPLVMGDPAHPEAPLTGALRDYMEQELVRGAGLQLQWAEPTSYGRALENLRNGKIDILLMTSSKLEERPGVLTFGWSYLRSQPHLAVLKGSPLQSVQSLQQLAGMEIGWVDGSPLVEGMEQIPIRWQRLAAADWQLMNLRKLQAGRIQAVFYENEYSPRWFARKERIEIQLLPLPMPGRVFTMAYSQKADAAAIARFDKAGAAAFAGEQFRQYLDLYMKTK